jgi:ribose/xylose/arabinose/galactoside ABC-type transport system permease subunit
VGRKQPQFSGQIELTVQSSAVRVLSDLRQFGIYWLLLLTVLVAAVCLPTFRSYENLTNILNQSASLAVLSVGQSFVILCGLIDLSVGQLLGLVVVLGCALMGLPSGGTFIAVSASLGLGAFVGAANGLLNNLLRIHPLILTFGTMGILQGIIFVFTDRSVGTASPTVVWLANGQLAGIPISTMIVAAITAGAYLILHRTRFGRHIYAVGGNEENARRVGVNTALVKFLAFVMSGLSASIAGILVAGRLGTGYPNAGIGFELDAIVAVVLGGTSLAGGAGSVVGSAVAAIALGVASNLFNLLGISVFVQMLAKGLIVIAAVLFNQVGGDRE